MSLQDLLTKDYAKKPQPIILRLTIIIGNLLIFLYCSGFYLDSKFGPIILKSEAQTVKDEMRKFSTLDMVSIMLSVIVAVRQLDFRRPEIDSFNEIVYLPALEFKSTFMLLLFTIFKLFYQIPDKKTGIIGWEGFPFQEFLKLNKKFREDNAKLKDEYLDEEKWTIFCNCVLVLSAAFCLWHSLSFKYEIRNTEKRMILKSLDIGNIITGLIVISQLTTVIFIEDTKYLGILLLVVIVIDIFRIVLKEYLETKGAGNIFALRDYVHSVKMFTIILFTIVLHGSVGAFVLENLGNKKESSTFRAASYIFLFYRNAQMKGTVIWFH